MNRALAALALMFGGFMVHAQNVDALLAMLKADNAWTLQQQRTICEVPAPPFKESVRAL